MIVGAGPAGLAAAYELGRHGIPTTILERNDQVGGLARTLWFSDHGFDIGPHRFFTKSREVVDLWHEVLGSDLLEVDRLTRIYYKGKYFSYPLRPLDALSKLGIGTTLRAMGSYAAQRFKKRGEEPDNFEDWITEQFGKVLFEVFFKSYTEKVWGIPCDRIGKEWAGQRIRGLNLTQAIRHALTPRGKAKVRSLVEQFYYPRRGAGQLYEKMTELITAAGSTVHLERPVTRYEGADGRIARVHTSDGSHHDVDHVFISAPITSVVRGMDAPPEVRAAAEKLTYRSHITVNLITRGAPPFPDNWIYIHDPTLKVARVANYGSFSDALITPGTSALAAEYFCWEDDEIWVMEDDDLIALALRELEAAGLLSDAAFVEGFVVREADSYPTYYLGHEADFGVVRRFVDSFENVTMIGRGGMYRYNNQDHAILTGLYAARNYMGTSDFDLFAINAEEEYLEEESRRP